MSHPRARIVPHVVAAIAVGLASVAAAAFVLPAPDTAAAACRGEAPAPVSRHDGRNAHCPWLRESRCLRVPLPPPPPSWPPGLLPCRSPSPDPVVTSAPGSAGPASPPPTRPASRAPTGTAGPHVPPGSPPTERTTAPAPPPGPPPPGPPAPPGPPGPPGAPSRAPASPAGSAAAAAVPLSPPGLAAPAAPPTPRGPRTSFLDALPRVSEVPAGRALLGSTLLAAALMLLVGFPADLFNRTLAANYAEIRARLPRSTVAESLAARVPGPLRLGGFVVLGAVVHASRNAGLGLDGRSVALVAALAAALALTTVAAEAGPTAYLRRLGVRRRVRGYPAGLAVAAACVALSRLGDLYPGYVYGVVVAGAVVAGTRLAPRDAGRAAASRIAGLMVGGVLAWLVWSALPESGGSVAESIARTTTAAVAVVAWQRAVFGLTPLAFLDGIAVRAWNPRVWAALYGVGLLGFLHVLGRPVRDRAAHDGGSDVPEMLGLFVAFGAVSVAFWAYFRFRR